MVTISETEGNMINRLRFFSLLSVVMIHSSVYKQPEAEAALAEPVMQCVKQWHSLFVSSHALVVLFIISGYLFFRKASESWSFRNDYLGKLRSRLSGLLTPYLVWCTLYIAYKVFRSHFELSAGNLLHAYWPLSPTEHVAAPGFWFIRSLICFSLLSPLYYLVYRYLKHFTLLLCLALSLCKLPPDFCYFNWPLLLGGYLAYSGITLTRITELFPWKPALLGACALSVAAAFAPLPDFVKLAFSQPSVVLWGAGLSGLFLRCPLPSCCTPSAGMFLYASHFIICGFISVFLLRYLPINLPMVVADMWLTWFLATCVCLGMFAVVKRVPHLTAILTGGRE